MVDDRDDRRCVRCGKWKCSHVLEALGRDEETAQADEKACELADRLNKEKT